MVPKFRAFIKSQRMMEVVAQIIWHKEEISRVLTHKNGVLDTHLADDIILMQSTGLFDDYGVEIFEGDVLQRILPNGVRLIGTVEFKKGCFLVDGVEVISEDYTVIGNIHENPGLVEVRE